MFPFEVFSKCYRYRFPENYAWWIMFCLDSPAVSAEVGGWVGGPDSLLLGFAGNSRRDSEIFLITNFTRNPLRKSFFPRDFEGAQVFKNYEK